jgi:hypothetical protein
MLTLKQITDKGFKAKEIADRVFLIEDFLTAEEQKRYLDLGEATSQDIWEKYYMDNMESFAELKFGRRDIDNLVKEGKLEITADWNDKVLKIDMDEAASMNDRLNLALSDIDEEVDYTRFFALQRQYSGIKLGEHVDNHTDPSLIYACVAYINDDYNGGEIFFSSFNLSIKPKSGSLLVFPTSKQWSHGVTEVSEGPTRYVLPCFVRRKKFYENNKY